MRWIIFIILLYVAAGLTSAQFLGFPHEGTFLTYPRIEYIAILVIFYSLFGEENQAPIFALAAGAVLDLMSVDDVLGIRTMSMGLMSLAIVKIRLSVFREQFFSQMVITFLAVMLFATIVGLLVAISPDFQTAGATTKSATQSGGLASGSSGAHMGFFRYLGFMSGNAIYTGIVSPAFFWVFLKMRGMMGIAIQTKRGR